MKRIDRHRSESGTTVWRTSSYSGDQGDCVQVAGLAGVVAVRDSKNPHLGMLRFSPGAWDRLLAEVKGEM
ncbi:DUF397 domain-containing protein [Streptomyces armeniacus]|uniref:DUF397 domain-containing protein n=1 Tax=Streptomyces armeniacus TaxID=83291 RepID=A0A345XMJ1_9ACTN|nr:DUF397 domain-containing protein [Streptomyces armeniacus]AXK32857.1 DUF397 domain-containing protein [Streptomyces armeniacus]